MKYRKQGYASLIIGLLIVILSSCIGVTADITVSSNGSGTIELEYRLSRLAESLGKLDGNERWPTVPIGKADFERSLARLPGIKLRSFSTKNDGQDLVNTVKLEFSDPAGLVRFLDATGQRAVLSQENGKYRLSLTLFSGSGQIDPDLMALFTAVSQGYSLRLTLTAPREGTLSVYDSTGNPLGNVSAITIVPKGKTVSFKSLISDIFTLSNGAKLELTWE
ncbi:MAG: hypothetical protein LBD29_09720 [Treponema sp.]|jgi:hypothetical protein|nr:hypothetical protein [Treponema sp.]